MRNYRFPIEINAVFPAIAPGTFWSWLHDDNPFLPLYVIINYWANLTCNPRIKGIVNLCFWNRYACKLKHAHNNGMNFILHHREEDTSRRLVR